MKKLANIISSLFHPLLMATYGCLLLFFGLTNSVYYLFTPLRIKIVITIVVFAFTFLLPVLNLLILYKMKYISSLKIESRNQRTFPLIMTSLCYFGLYYMILDFNVWPTVKLFILGGALCIFFAAIINIWWKISAHMIGIGGVIGALVALCYFTQMPVFVAISGCVLLAGLIGFARLYLDSHTEGQIYVGFTFGCFLQFSLFLLAQSITFV